jgi:lipopolysaccharide export system permease protein
MILHAYFARRFFKVFFATLLIFFAFLTLIDLVEQMRRFSSDNVRFQDVLKITLMNAPNGLYEILPLVMILSSVSLFLSLARSSELVVARASGRSALITLMAPLFMSGLIGVVAVTLFNPIVAATSKQFLQLENEFKNTGGDVILLGREGLWLRQGELNDGQTVIHAARVEGDVTRLYDVSFVQYDQNGVPTRRIVAEQARLSEFGWLLFEAKEWPLIGTVNPEQNARIHDILSLPTSLTQDRIRNSFSAPSVVSIWTLNAHIKELKSAGFSPRRHEVWMQMELARPLFLMAMVLVGAAFTMRHSRFGKTGVSVLAAVMLGFGLYYIRNFAQILGENGQLPTLIAAWTPPVASFLLALGLILHMEDG